MLRPKHSHEQYRRIIRVRYRARILPAIICQLIESKSCSNSFKSRKFSFDSKDLGISEFEPFFYHVWVGVKGYLC